MRLLRAVVNPGSNLKLCSRIPAPRDVGYDDIALRVDIGQRVNASDCGSLARVQMASFNALLGMESHRGSRTLIKQSRYRKTDATQPDEGANGWCQPPRYSNCCVIGAAPICVGVEPQVNGAQGW